jgi:hypothetical protein
LDQLIEAAEAFQHAAEQAQNRTPEQENEISRLYAEAYQLFEGQGMDAEAARCWQWVIQYRRMPWVIVLKGQAQKAFIEETFSTLVLTLRNTGRGVAHNVRVRADSQRFELDASTTGAIAHLAPGREREISLHIRPLKNQVGELPLVLHWDWTDQKEQAYQQDKSWPVDVKRLNEPGSSATPVEIHYHGPVYQAQENIEIVGQDKIGGDKVTGDQVQAGGQKGDKVVMARSTAARPPRLCPNCGLQVESAKFKFCKVCGADLKG